MKETDENIETKFGNRKKSQPFRVPDNYFETFEDRLMARIRAGEQPDKRRSLIFYLKPALMVAAIFAFAMLLIYVPTKEFFSPAGKAYVSKPKVTTDSVDSGNVLPATIFSYFSEAQFLSAVSAMEELESADTISNDNLGDFIAANYNDYDVIANN
jgi:hypothetical protein